MIWLFPVLLALFGRIFLLISQGNSLGKGHIRDFNISESLPVILLLISIGGLFPFGAIEILYVIWIYGFAYFSVSVLYLWKTFKNTGNILKPEIHE